MTDCPASDDDLDVDPDSEPEVETQTDEQLDHLHRSDGGLHASDLWERYLEVKGFGAATWASGESGEPDVPGVPSAPGPGGAASDA